jgi:acetyltransferase-like isoleucine patch superfamily enzyme
LPEIEIVRMKADLISFAKLLWRRQFELAGQVLPEDWIGCRLRGILVRRFLKACGKNFQLGLAVKLERPENISLGRDVYIGHGCWISGHGGGITMEDEVMLGPHVTMVSNNHVMHGGSARFAKGAPAPIVIGKGCWIGTGAKIIAGVTLAPGCIVGTGSRVNGG